MNANKCSHNIRTAEETFWNREQGNTNAGEDLYTRSLRQLTMLYHLVHYLRITSGERIYDGKNI